MSNNDYIIREIEPSDNFKIAEIIKNIYSELNIPKIGTTAQDTNLDNIYESFNNPKSVYYIIEKNRKILGGAGITQLPNTTENICELQKMYLAPSSRGRGIGKKLMELCLAKANELKYEKCYLETHSSMKEAQNLYKKFEFKISPISFGKTDHFNCQIWMIKTLT